MTAAPMALQLTNTLTRRTEPFVPMEPGKALAIRVPINTPIQVLGS